MRERPRNLVVRISNGEHEQLRALAAAADMPAAFLIRRWIRDAYAALGNASASPAPQK